MNEQPEAQRSPTWMIDGKPGQIVAALADAIKASKPVEKTRKGDMSYLNVDDIKTAAKASLSAHGIITQWETVGEPWLADSGKAPFTVIAVRCTFVAPDGSYIVSTMKGGGQAGMGRSLTVAVTAAVKQILGLTLQLATGDDDARHDEEPTPELEIGEDLQYVLADIRAAQNFQELAATTATQQARRLKPPEAVTANRASKERRQELTLLGQGDSRGVDFNDFKPRAKK